MTEAARQPLRVGIDASNLRSGGTVTHLLELLSAAEPSKFGIERVVVWGGSAVLGRLPERDWLLKSVQPKLEQTADAFRDRRQFQRALWQRFRLPRLAQEIGCHVLFVPGGMDNSGVRPMVTMSRNMLPFDWSEASRYGFSLALLRLALLRFLQTRTFRRADGLILLTDYARRRVLDAVSLNHTPVVVIPHGVSTRFACEPRPQKALGAYSLEQPLRALYVSTVDAYKHQWCVAEAVASLRSSGVPIVLDLVGPANGPALEKLDQTLRRLDKSSSYLRYHGPVPYESLHDLYRRADLKIFASSCENMPNILIESMAAGLPIACSNRGPMPEVLGEGGIYFDPERPSDIAQAVRQLCESPDLRATKARIAYSRAQQFSWKRCADETFKFLAACAVESANKTLVRK